MNSPARFTKDRGDFKKRALMWDVLNVVAAHRRSLPASINLEQVEFLRPYSLAAICAIGARTSQSCRLILPSDTKCKAHLLRLGVQKWFHIPGAVSPGRVRSTNVVVEQLEDKPGNATDRVVDLLTQSTTLAPGEGPTIKDHLDEVIRNALVHSESEVGCFVAGQMFPQKHLLELAIVDLGLTIPVHLRRNPKHAHIKGERSAVISATENGVSGTVGLNRWNEPNSGAGLYSLREFCKSGRGELAIVTGTVIAVFDDSETPTLWTYRGGFGGCLVNIRFFLNKGLPSRESSTTIW